MREIVLFLLASLIVSCAKHSSTGNHPTQINEASTSCHCTGEEAFPEIHGQSIIIGHGQNAVELKKKGEFYVLLGDIVLSEMQVNILNQHNDSLKVMPERTGTGDFSKLWPNGIIPFAIDPLLPNQQRVIDAIANWQNNTSIRFVQRTNETNYAYFTPSTGCASYVGMIGGAQNIFLADGCTAGNAVHEIGHTIGFYHEQSRTDRDKSIIINWNNIQPGFQSNFQTYAQLGLSGFQIDAFDFGSIMLYGSYDFSANNLPTITQLNGAVFDAQRIGLSAGDIQTANYMYNNGIYVRLNNTTIYCNNDNWWYSDCYGDVIANFYQDPAGTIPATLVLPINLNLVSYDQESCAGSTTNTFSSQTIPAGSTSANVGSWRTKNQYDAAGNPLICIYQSVALQPGIGYKSAN